MSEYQLISPKQFYERINKTLDEPIGINTIYRMVKQPGFPSVKLGGRYYVIENKVKEWLEALTGKRKK